MDKEEVTITLGKEHMLTVLLALNESATRWRNRPGMRGNTVEFSVYDAAYGAIDEQLREVANA